MSSRNPAKVHRPAALLLLAGVLVLVALLSLRVGSIPVSTADAVAALTRYDPDNYSQLVVRTMRLPRTVIGLGVGAALAAAGAAMQAATRNPLAEPSLLGVNAGASFAIVAAVYFGHMTHPLQYLWFAFAGALGAAVLVYAIASAGGGASPVKLALAGVIVSALLGSWTTALLILNKETLEMVRFWLAGSLAGRSLNLLPPVAPFLAAGLLGVLLVGRQLNTLSLGEETARSLGMHTGRMRALVAVLVMLLAGSAVALAGPVGFVGLAVPHIVRAWIGADYRWILPFCLVLGPALLLGADILGRVMMRPAEVQVGVVTALVGAPFLIYLARRRQVAEP
ncbi:FecCD family ABC transporter permease [Symbiobacterium thermophilum]|uniref:Iron ABC transporter permease protein n=2 Tax=Symbiobacterium thermophilum TaxID=2734 RepID=Q67PX3_SYMTH|nr:iron ABC transporter permease [Symbiobacterium thermophilum]BAD40270.1 iron ABC transporter permease protein [Symbiobacterium thermophilum IAM 14863]